MTPPARFAAVAVLVAGTGAMGAVPAHASACPTSDGVTVVVDFDGAGGSGIATGCVGGGGDSAASLFGAAGHELTRVQRQMGAVCKVDGLREEDSCVNMPPQSAFWGLFWSDGDGGWVFSQEGVDGLNVPDGGSVAFAFQDGGDDYEYPGVAPAEHAAEPSPEPEPTRDPTNQPSQPPTSGADGTSGGGGPATEPTGSGSGSASASASPEPGDRREGHVDRDREKVDRQRGDRGREEPTDGPTGDPSAMPTDDTSTVAEPPASGDDSALPVWVDPTAVGGLLGVAGVATYLRRRTR